MSVAPDLTIKRGDAGKIITGQFTDANGAAVNCTGSTSRKILMKRGSTLKINSTFTFTSESTGTWSYTLQAADVDTPALYALECEAILPGPQTVTFPTNNDKPYLVVRVQQDLG